MKQKLIILVAVMAAIMSATAAMGATYFVRTDGVDSNNGLSNSATGAFRSIQHAADVAIAGDVVEIQQGTYNEAVSVSSPATPEARITFKGVGKVTLDGQNTLNVAIFTNYTAGNVDFINLEIRNYTGFAFYFYSYDNHIDNCDIHDNEQAVEGYGAGLNFGGQIFTNTRFYNHRATYSGYVIRPYAAAKGLTFDNCDFFNNNGIVLWWAHTEGVSTVIHSRFYNNPGTAVGDGDLGGTVRVYNSVFYNNGAALTTWDDRYGSVKDWKNNIVVNNGLGIAKSGADGGVVLNDYNLVWNNTTNYDNVYAFPGAHDVNADPQFISAAAYDFHLQNSSPAIDSGLNLGGEFYGAATDMGAFEARTASTLYVRTDGSDSSNGLSNSSAGAFRSVQHAVDVALPGDTISIQEGVYNEAITVLNGGTAEQHITVKGAGQVILDGQQQLGSAIVTGDNGRFVDFENLEIRNYISVATYFHSYDNRFTNCDFNNNVAIYEGWAEYAYPYTGYGRQSFVNCRFHDNKGPDHLIRAYFARGVTFDGCDFYNNQNSIVIWWAHSQDVNTIIRSRFYNNSGAATGTGDLIGTVNVFNSVFYNNGSALTTWDDRPGSIKNWKNNILINNGTAIAKSSADGGVVINDYNLVWNNSINYDNVYTFPGAHDLAVDPQFVNAAANDFTLMPFSPAIDTGISLGSPFYGAAPDLGAFEKMLPSTRSTLSGALGNNGWFTSDVTATISSDIPAATAQIKSSLNAAPEVTTPGNTATVNVSQERTNALFFYAVDTTGKQEAANTISIKIDKSAPVTVATASGTMGDNNRYRSNVVVTLAASDSTSGVNTTEYSLNGTAWSTYSAPVTISTNGTTTINFRSTDKAGISEATKSLTVSIDKTAPTVTCSVPANNDDDVSTSDSIVLTFSENIVAGSAYSSISLKKGSTSVPMTKSISGNRLTIRPSSELDDETLYTVTLPVNSVKDTAGNTSAAFILRFTTED